MSKGNWRNWDEIECEGNCGARIYKKYGKKHNGKLYCTSCYEHAKKEGKGWHEAKDSTGVAPEHSAVQRKGELKDTLRTPMASMEPDWRAYLEEQKAEPAKLNFEEETVTPGIEMLDIDYVLDHAILNYSPEEYPIEQPYIDNRLIPHMRTTKLPLPVIEIYNRPRDNHRPHRPRDTNIHVIDGNHRIVALKKLGFRRVPFVVYRETGKESLKDAPRTPMVPEGAIGRVEGTSPQTQNPEPYTNRNIHRDEVIDILAKQPNNANKSRESLGEKWVASNTFVEMSIPVNSVGMATEPMGKSVTKGNIIVDLNIAEVGRYKGQFGTPPDVLVIDGKHRLAEAIARGERTIMAYVGEKAVPYIKKQIQQQAEKDTEINRAVKDFMDVSNTSPAGALRKLRSLLPEKDVERIRQERKNQIERNSQKVPLSDLDREELEFRMDGDPKRSPDNNITFAQMKSIGKSLADYFEKNNIGIEEIYFTGSRVKGYARPDSDLDIVVIVKDKHLWNNAQEYTTLCRKVEADIKPVEKEHGMKFELLIGKTLEDFGFGQDWNTRYGYFGGLKP